MAILTQLYGSEFVTSLDRPQFDVLEAIIDREFHTNKVINQELSGALKRSTIVSGVGDAAKK